MKTMWVNQSFDTSEEEAMKHWRWTENKHAPLTRKKRRKKTRRKLGDARRGGLSR